MREVIIFNATTNPQVCFPKSVEIGRGHFHGWATDTDTEDGEPVVNTRALVEFADGHVERIFPTRIKFATPYATPAGIARACGLENEVERAAEVSATNPPKGWRLAKAGEYREFGYIWFDPDPGVWCMGYNDHFATVVTDGHPVANPIEVAP